MNPEQAEVLLCRHCAFERVRDADGRLRERIPEAGLRAAGTLAERLAALPGEGVLYSGPRERAIETARPLADRLALTLYVDPDLDELRLGRHPDLDAAATARISGAGPEPTGSSGPGRCRDLRATRAARPGHAARGGPRGRGPSGGGGDPRRPDRGGAADPRPGAGPGPAAADHRSRLDHCAPTLVRALKPGAGAAILRAAIHSRPPLRSRA
ncbi:MAG: histidine phosphatase family protein [Gammaproteobacteria bacterium]|nr:histidine phosphatase family protein [Gammaproteobacteria bacterium]